VFRRKRVSTAALGFLGVLVWLLVGASSALGASQSIIFVVDVSGSMSGTPLQQAKVALHEAVGALPADADAGLRSYEGACGNPGVLRIPVGPVDRAAFDAAIDSLATGGTTPTPDALRAAAGDLPSTGNRTVVLISDGQSTCGDPCPVAAELSGSLGINFKVHTVGFQASGNAESELQCIAQATGGTYVPVTDGAQLGDVLGGLVGGQGTPVIMVHGIDATAPYGNDCAVTWDDAKQHLRDNGYAGRDLLTVAYYEQDANCDRVINGYSSPIVGNTHFDGRGAHAGTAGGHTAEAAIEHLGYHFAWFIYEEYSKDNRKVDILAHSMGGLLSRYAISQVEIGNEAFPPKLLVGNVVTLGTPHGGARLVGLAGCNAIGGRRQCSQMRPGSAFLRSLEDEGWNPQAEGGTDWTVIGSDDDNAVAADRAVGTNGSRRKDQYIGACHKYWYPATRTEGSGRQRQRFKQPIEHSDYHHDGTIAGGMDASNLLAYTSGGGCGAPLTEARGQLHPMGVAALALSSNDY
jgi:hypothetical protein